MNNIEQTYIETTNDKPSIIALCLIFLYYPITEIGGIFVVAFIPFFRRYDIYLTIFILFAVFIWAIFLKPIKIKKDMIYLPLLITYLWLISFIFFPVNRPYLYMPFFYLTCHTLPAYFFARSISNFKTLNNYLKKISSIVIVVSLLSLFIKTSIENTINYDMSFSYALLPSVLVMISNLFLKFNKMEFIIGITGAAIILINGSRGAGLCLVGLPIVYSLFNFYKKQNLKLLIFSTIFLLYITSDLFFTNITDVSIFLARNNIRSRTLEKILTNEITWDNGRLLFFNSSIDLIQENPLLGLGMAGDRLSIAQSHHTTKISYSHNIILEMMVQYGLFIGGYFILIIFIIISWGLTIKNDKYLYHLIIAFSPLFFFKLMLSSTYISEIHFFMLLGLCINSIENSKKNREEGK